ncbi:MAG TPA: response regulator [Chloroflexota bacterium]|nr:response regulator [Chloroflexota bacterium]
MKALLVEDDDDARALMEIVLTERGHEVVAFADAEPAWELCQRQLYPLMVLDWVLPAMNGLELCRRVRGLPGGDAPVVVVITARHQGSDLAEVLAAGADDYLAKPFGLEALEVRLEIAERRVVLVEERRRAVQALEEAARLQGALLASATVEHNLGNQLALTMGYAEMLAHDPRLDPALRPWAERALGGVEAAVATLDKLRRLIRIEPSSLRGGSTVLDLDRSSGETRLTT